MSFGVLMISVATFVVGAFFGSWITRKNRPDRILVHLKTCGECGGSVACFPDDPAPRRCKEHTGAGARRT